MAQTMDDNTRIIEDLLEKVVKYGRAELDLAKLKVIDKASETVSATIPRLLVIVLASVFLLFLNIGAALWAGELFGNLYLGFFAVAAFYGIIALILHLFMHRWLKRKVGDYIIRRILK